MAYVSYYYQTGLESDFTIVNWDQRGCGRTYYANPNMNMKTELSTDILLSDLNDLTDYLMKRFGQDKVIIMGHSWGSLLGITYVREYPEKVSAYIGIGQVTNDNGAILLAANTAIEKAAQEGNEKDVEKLSAALGRFTKEKNYNSLDARNYMGMVGLEQKYLTYDHKMSPLQQIWLGLSSPYISLNDIRWFIGLNNIDKTFKLEAPLMNDVFYKSDINKQSKEFQVPMYFISGESDWTTPRVMVEEYFKSVQAPDKDMIVIKNAGHSPFIDDPNAFCRAVKRVLSNKSSKK